MVSNLCGFRVSAVLRERSNTKGSTTETRTTQRALVGSKRNRKGDSIDGHDRHAVVGIAVLSSVGQAALPEAAPDSVGMDPQRLTRIDELVAEACFPGEMAGCVVCVGRQGSVVFFKAYGERQVEPQREAMTTDTVFDMASITKRWLRRTTIMVPDRTGAIALQDRVAQHLAGIRGRNGKQDVTVEDLLLHQGGLIPDNAPERLSGRERQGVERRVCPDVCRSEPGSEFVYTDVGFIVLGELVRRLSGQDLRQFSQAHIFQPLGMYETGYLPAEPLRVRAARHRAA